MNGWKYIRDYVRDFDFSAIEGRKRQGVHSREVPRVGLVAAKRKKKLEASRVSKKRPKSHR